MIDIKKYIESGILELYVLGLTTDIESLEIEQLAGSNEEIRMEIEEITNALEYHSSNTARPFNPTIKTFVLATIDYSERIKNGEPASFPPALNPNSTIADYKQWLNRDDLFLPDDFDQAYAKIIGYTPQMTTAVVWLKTLSPPEIHTNEFEKFLILEGSCDVTIGKEVHQLVPGDYLNIPLHIEHDVKITSSIPCKFILQRIAA